MALKTNYVDDIFDGDNRKYRQINNSDGTISLSDVTNYSQMGDKFGASDINATNTEVNELNTALTAQGLSLQGSTVSFPSDGTIVETYESGDKKITSFPSNGNIVETIKDSANTTKYTITTSFPSDGTIVKKVEAAS